MKIDITKWQKKLKKKDVVITARITKEQADFIKEYELSPTLLFEWTLDTCMKQIKENNYKEVNKNGKTKNE